MFEVNEVRTCVRLRLPNSNRPVIITVVHEIIHKFNKAKGKRSFKSHKALPLEILSVP